jgi:hypothetical protein
MADLYEVAELAGGRWTIGAPLRGGPDRGQFRAAGVEPALVSVGAPQRRPLAQVEQELGYSVPGVAPLLAVTDVVIEGVPYHALIEGEPPGRALTDDAPANRRAVARELAEIVARAHAAGHVLVGIRPELVYFEDERCTGIAPRAEPFFAGMTERCYGVPPCFDEIYLSPEALMLRPLTPASDVFSLCATLVYLLEGAHPFAGDTIMERVTAALHGNARLGSVEPVIRAGLSVDPAGRPDARTLAVALRG